MNGLQWFILSILIIIAAVGAHRRIQRYLLVKRLLNDGTTPAQIEKIMRAYAWDNDKEKR
jgi:hypothetical protein